MNNLSDVLAKLKKENYCLYYSDKINLNDFIHHLRYLHDKACDYSNSLMKINDLDWSLMSSCQSFLDIVIDYFESVINLQFEMNLSNICYFFHVKMCDHIKLIKNKEFTECVFMLIQTFLLLFFILCYPDENIRVKKLSRYDLIKMS